MRTTNIIIITLLLASAQACTREEGFTMKGHLNMPDGTSVGIVSETDTSMSVEMASGEIRNGEFLLTGKTEKPLRSTFMTNNLALVEKNGWPQDSIKWTYTAFFLSNADMEVSPDLVITGGQPQSDWLELQAMTPPEGEAPADSTSDASASAGGASEKDAEAPVWQFIETHPKSSVSAWLAINELKRAYRLSAEQVEMLDNTIDAADDTLRMRELKNRIAMGKLTTKGMAPVDFQVADVSGKESAFSAILPKGKYVLVDFWASWCGICIYNMPAVRELADKYKGMLEVVAVSIDTDEKAWRGAMEKHPEPWPQYITTKQGYKDLCEKYQIGNGVPYYLLIDKDGKVIEAPEDPKAAGELLARIAK